MGDTPKAAFALLLLALGMFAIFSPFNGASNDEWSYLYAGQQGEWHGKLVNRDFAMGSAVLAAWILPNRPQNLFIFHLFLTFLVSLGIFHLGKRLIGQAWLALLWAGVYLVYIPFNMDASRALFIQTYSWAIFLAVASLVLLLEFVHRQHVLWAVGAGMMAYIAARVYEGFIPLLWVLPALFWVYGQNVMNKTPRGDVSASAGFATLAKRPIIGWSVWYMGVGYGSLAFALPFLQGKAQYQNRVEAQGSIDWLGRSREFFALTFPLEAEIFPTQLDYFLPALLLVGLFLLMVVRVHRGDFLPLRVWLGGMTLGFILVWLSGLALLYANLHTEPRAQFLPAPFAAWVWLCAIGLVALAGKFLLRIPPHWTTLVLTGLLLVLGLQWSLEAQIWADQNRTPTFDQKTPFFRQLQALIPSLPPHSAILYACEAPQNGLQVARLADLFAVSYLYGEEIPLIHKPFHIAPLRVPILDLQTDSLVYAHEYDLRRVGQREFEFAYSEVVVVSCDDTGIYIVEQWQNDQYNPYGRITKAWLENERVLNR